MKHTTMYMAAAGLVLALVTAAAAGVPRLINYQGILASDTGEPLEGAHLLLFNIYPDSAQSAPSLWIERHENVPIEDGLFNVILGSIMEFPEGLFADEERWLGVAVDSDPEMRPRMQVTSVAFALRAAVADSALGAPQGADGDWIITGSDMHAGVSGNVGIGIATPGKRLQVGNNTVPDSEGMIRLASRSGTQGSNRIWDIGVPETDGDTTGPGYSFVVDDISTGTIPELMVKYGTGHVGIGTVTPDAPLEVYKPASSTADAALKVTTRYEVAGLPVSSSLLFNRTTIDGESTFGTGSLSLNAGSAGNVYLATGGGEVGIGTTSTEAKLHVAGAARVDQLDCTGPATVEIIHITGADVAEKFPVRETIEPGMVVAIDRERPGELCLCREAYDRRVAGVVSGAHGLPAGAVLGNSPGSEHTLPVALSGRVWVRCDARQHAIEPGDLLTTADTPGHAMKVIDHARAQGAVLGKAMTALNEGTGWVLVLVNLQ